MNIINLPNLVVKSPEIISIPSGPAEKIIDLLSIEDIARLSGVDRSFRTFVLAYLKEVFGSEDVKGMKRAFTSYLKHNSDQATSSLKVLKSVFATDSLLVFKCGVWDTALETFKLSPFELLETFPDLDANPKLCKQLDHLNLKVEKHHRSKTADSLAYTFIVPSELKKMSNLRKLHIQTNDIKLLQVVLCPEIFELKIDKILIDSKCRVANLEELKKLAKKTKNPPQLLQRVSPDSEEYAKLPNKLHECMTTQSLSFEEAQEIVYYKTL
ncbi:MAG: hypothetical protein JSR58_05890 [Verrucomicrobia bacterium]|nr:hypothetical protein [Verrucomicrobiota bacterium]